jgi:hypothetical protein
MLIDRTLARLFGVCRTHRPNRTARSSPPTETSCSPRYPAVHPPELAGYGRVLALDEGSEMVRLSPLLERPRPEVLGAGSGTLVCACRRRAIACRLMERSGRTGAMRIAAPRSSGRSFLLCPAAAPVCRRRHPSFSIGHSCHLRRGRCALPAYGVGTSSSVRSRRACPATPTAVSSRSASLISPGVTP